MRVARIALLAVSLALISIQLAWAGRGWCCQPQPICQPVAPVCYAPQPVSCQPATTCCAPQPTCCQPLPACSRPFSRMVPVSAGFGWACPLYPMMTWTFNMPASPYCSYYAIWCNNSGPPFAWDDVCGLPSGNCSNPTDPPCENIPLSTPSAAPGAPRAFAAVSAFRRGNPPYKANKPQIPHRVTPSYLPTPHPDTSLVVVGRRRIQFGTELIHAKLFEVQDFKTGDKFYLGIEMDTPAPADKPVLAGSRIEEFYGETTDEVGRRFYIRTHTSLPVT